MDRPRKRWQVAPRLTQEADLELQQYPLFIRQILYNREITSAKLALDFLEAGPPLGTDPFGLLGMEAAVGRIQEAIARGEPVAVYGDYDADGVTATALLVQALKALGANVREYIPNRFEEGYGLNREALLTLHEGGVRLVITVDCGIRSPEEGETAAEIGLDLIITDHHHPGERLPRAVAVINPKQDGDSYPEKDLAGVGLAYKLASALISRCGRGEVNAEDFLDLVALGTVADLAPLKGENRALVRAGIERLRDPRRQGVLSLMLAANLQPQQVTASDLGFILGPRLNAAGRLDSALAALNLLTCSDLETAGKLAQELDDQNRERQKITQQMQAQAEEIALSHDPNAQLLFAASPDFNPGVVGLAASRLMDLYYRPAIVAHQGEEYTRASCRSIAELHITKALDACADLLVRHGGHAAAAGFTVRNEHLPELLGRLRQYIAGQLDGKDLRRVLNADYELPLDQVTPSRALAVLGWLDKLQPCGIDNPQPVFVSRAVRVVERRAVGRENSHLKLKLAAGTCYHDAIAFRQGYLYNQLSPQVDVLYCLERNEYNGQVKHQLNIKDIKPAGEPDD
jgi:single-stranded-DNA-specific exonuclease